MISVVSSEVCSRLILFTSGEMARELSYPEIRYYKVVLNPGPSGAATQCCNNLLCQFRMDPLILYHLISVSTKHLSPHVNSCQMEIYIH